MHSRKSRWIKSIRQIFYSPGWLLFLGFTLLFSLTYAGVFRQDDEHILAARAQSLALWGELEEPQVYGNQRLQALIPLGDKATQIEPAHAFLAAPLYRLGLALEAGGTQTMFLLNIFVSAGCVALVYASARKLGSPARASIWAAVLFGAGTMVWPFSATLYRDSLAMLMAGLAWLAWISFDRAENGRVGRGILLALALLGGLLAKNTNMALILAVVIVQGGSWIVEQMRSQKWENLLRVTVMMVGILIAWLALIPSTGPMARYSASYMGDLARYFAGSLNLDLVGALLGPLFSPSKSIVLFSPPLILGLFGLRWAWKEHRRALTLAMLMTLFLFLGQGLFYRTNWAGIFGWGLRYTLPIIPIWMTLAAPAIVQFMTRGHRWVLPGMLLTGVGVQLAGVLPNWGAMYAHWTQSGLDPYQPAAVWDWHFNAIPAGWRLLTGAENLQPAWMRLLSGGAVLAWLVPGIILALLVAVGFLCNRTSEPRSNGFKPSLLILSLLACLAPFTLPPVYRNDPAWAGNRSELLDAVEYLNANAQPGEAVALDAYATPLWMAAMNHWQSQARWYSLAYEIPLSNQAPADGLSGESQALFESLASQGDFWYLTSTDAPDYDYHHESEWLAGQYAVLDAIRFGTSGQVALWRFQVTNTTE